MDYSKLTKKELIDELQRLKQTASSDPSSGISGDSTANSGIRIFQTFNKIIELESLNYNSYDDYIMRIIGIIPEAFRFPQFTEALISIDSQNYHTQGYCESAKGIQQNIRYQKRVIGQIRVCYNPEPEAGTLVLFTKEEKDLLSSLAHRISMLYDIRKKNKLLSISEKKYKYLLDNINDVIYEVDEKSTITYISPSIEKLLGYPPEELIGRSFIAIMGRNKAKVSERFIRLANEKGLTSDYEIHAKSGEKKWIRLSTMANYVNKVFVGGSGTMIDITEQKNYEVQLQKSSELYRSIISASPDAISITDLTGRLVYSSDINYSMFGYDQSHNFLDHNIYEYMIEEDRERIPMLLEKILKGERITSTEFTGLRANGSTFSIEVNTEIIKDSDGIPSNVLLIIRDISDRKAIERKLNYSEESFRSMVERINDIFYELDSSGTLKYISPVVESVLGYKPEEVIGKSIFTYMFPEDIPTIKEALMHLGKRDSTSLEYRYIAKDGSVNWFRSSTAPIMVNGEIKGGTGVLTNINSRKLAEIKLWQSEEKYKSLIDSSDAAITMIDKNGCLLYVNKIAAEPFNKEPEEIIGKNASELFPKEQIKVMKEDIKYVFTHGKGYTKELKLDFPGGPQWFRISVQPVRNESGKIFALMNHLTNISDIKEKEEMLMKSEQKYRTLFNESPDGNLIFQDGRFIECNKTAEQMLKGSREDIIGSTVNDLSPETQAGGIKTKDLLENILNETWEKGKNSFEWIHKDFEGNPIHVLVTLSLIEYEGKPSILAIWKDISDKKKAEEELLKFRTIAEKANYATTINSPDGEFIFVNQAYSDMVGYSVDELIGKRLNICFSDEQQPLVKPLLEDLKLKGELPSREIWLKRKDGNLIPTLLTATTIYNEAKEPLYLSATAIDISELKESEQTLKLSEEALNNAQMLAKMGSWELDMENNLLTCSRNLYDILGLPPETQINDEIFKKLLHPEDIPLLDETFAAIIETGKSCDLELRLRIQDGATRWIHNHVVPITKHGRHAGFKGVIRDITEKKLADEKIWEYNEKMAGIVKALPDFIFILDKHGNYLEYYGPDESLLEVSNHEMVGKNIQELFKTDHATLHLKKIQECYEKKLVINYVYEVEVSKRKKVFEIRLVPFGEDRIVRFVREITDIKEREQQIYNLSLALEQSPVAVIITSLHGEIEYANTAFQEITGYSAGEYIGKSTRILKSGSMDADFYADLWKKIKSGQNWHGELINKRKNGKLYWEEMSITPIHDENGQIKNYLAIKQDITERKKIEQEISALNANLELRVKERTEELAVMNDLLIEENEERKTIEEALKQKTAELENFFSVTLDLLLIADMNGRFEKVNRSWENILGFTIEELENGLLLDYVHPEDQDTTREILRQLSNRFPIINFVNRLRTVEGEYRFIEWHIVPVDEYIYGAARDITNRIVFEERLNLARKDAEEANKAKSEFLANMSHEIRTPMNAVLGYSELLGSTKMDQVQREYVSSIKSSGKSLLTLINDILDLSKIEAGKMNLEYDYINTHNFFNEFAAIFAFKIQEKNLQFKVEIASGTPQGIYVDEARLRQVVFNLIGNAIKFTDHGYIKLGIHSENPKVINYTETASEEVIDLVIEVEDTGIGISKEALESIFDSFIQENEFKKYGGTGLGLTISKKLIALMNGTILVNSEQDQGSLFTVRIPEIVYLKEFSSVISQQEIDPRKYIFEDATILLIDDVQDNRRYLKDVFRDTAIKVIEATNGISGLEKAIQESPDLIITDIRMPEMDGFELLEQLKSNQQLKDIPVIAYSASVLREQKEKIYNSAFAGLLVKPVKIADLYAQLLKLLPYSKVELPEPDEKAQELSVNDVIDREGLLRSLEHEYMDIWQTFSVRQPIKEVRKFGKDLVSLGEHHACPILTAYANDLVHASNSFNIEAILNLLGKYKQIIAKMKKVK